MADVSAYSLISNMATDLNAGYNQNILRTQQYME